MSELFTALQWSLKLAAWATPAIGRAWSLERSLNRVEGERNLKLRNYAEAEKYLTDAVAEADQRHHSVRRIQFRLELAEAQRKQGKLAQAESTVRTALEHTARISNPSGYVQCLDALAEVFHDGENFPAMEAVLQEGVRIEAAMPHPDPLRMARRIHRLGIARHKNGRSSEAIPALEKALAMHEETFGPDHPDTADVLGELGPIYRAQGNHERAQECLRRALRTHEREQGWDSEQAMRDLHHLAGSLEESGNIEGAADLYERALGLKLRMLGGSLDDLAEMQFGMAGIYIGWSNYARARELLAEAVGTFKRKKDVRLAVTYETIAHVEECSGRYQEAVSELGRAAKVWELLGDARRHELIENMEHRAELLDQIRRKGEAAWLRTRIAELNGASQAQGA
ncbi:MAG TPA: tetratricopeptide repeat protein [Bryobacteraceae bacterium]|nr:tetratricopeptide repeat protein [Bryobacteraceae bacterium]